MKILFSKTFIKKMKRYELGLRKRIMDAVSKLPHEGDIKKLKGHQLKNLFRLRIGKYRVIFMVREKEVLILDVDNRGDIYRHKS